MSTTNSPRDAAPKRKEKKSPRHPVIESLKTQEGAPTLEPNPTETVPSNENVQPVPAPNKIYQAVVTPRSDENMGVGQALQIKISKTIFDFSPLISVSSSFLEMGEKSIFLSLQLKEPSAPARPPQFINQGSDLPQSTDISKSTAFNRSKKFRTNVVQINVRQHDPVKPLLFDSDTFLFHLITTKRHVPTKKEPEELILFDLDIEAFISESFSNASSKTKAAKIFAEGHLVVPNVVDASRELLAGKTITFLIDFYYKHENSSNSWDRVVIGRSDLELCLDGPIVRLIFSFV